MNGEREPEALELLSEGRTLPPAEQLAVYRGSIASSLTAALGEVYPVCRRLVGERFSPPPPPPRSSGRNGPALRT